MGKYTYVAANVKQHNADKRKTIEELSRHFSVSDAVKDTVRALLWKHDLLP